MPATPDIRVFVKFKENTVFAGDDVECTITFKSVEPPPRRPPGSSSAFDDRRNGGPVAEPRENRRPPRTPAGPGPSRNPSVSSVSQVQRSARPSLQQLRTGSLSVVESFEKRQGSFANTSGVHIAEDAPERKKHGRSVSIISLNSDTGPVRGKAGLNGSNQQRPGLKHGRSASAQIVPTPRHGSHRQSTGGGRSLGQPSPRSATIPSVGHLDGAFGLFSGHAQRSPRIPESPAPSATEEAAVESIRPSPLGQNNFKFPANAPSPQRNLRIDSTNSTNSSDTRSITTIPIRSSSPRQQAMRTTGERPPMTNGQRPPLNRAFSVQSVDETPRASEDLYSRSNGSDETLMSEYTMQPSTRFLRQPFSSKVPSLLGPRQERTIETLMMGYVQISGNFTVDGSLVNQAPFEEVKRKAVVGGEGGGGVVGVTRPAAEDGFFGGLNWSGIGMSLGGFLRGGELSSIQEMKGIADSQTVPLITTAKSILFVDLRLAPGESRSYHYKFALPRGLPPTHKGRAMKVAYHLVIGTQRPGSERKQGQQMRRVEVPFRVCGGVNGQGEVLGHDLMSPYIILKDKAQTSALEAGHKVAVAAPEPAAKNSASSADFEFYIKDLLATPRKDSTAGLLSPTADRAVGPSLLPNDMLPQTPTSPSPQVQPSAEALIDHAIRTSSLPGSLSHSPTTFNITRSSVPIATFSLSRPALRLGEALTLVIDFSKAGLPCYALEATLESAERVDPALAIRSPQSIERATRRVWARSVDSCFWCGRWTGRWQVPISATHSFTTTGVGLDWFIRVEIVVARVAPYAAARRSSTDDDVEDDASRMQRATKDSRRARELLAEVGEDERGTVLVAAQRLPCESFEVTVPIKVFGAKTSSAEGGTGPEGMAV